MATTRPQDWPARLARFLDERRAMPFDWRANNCAFFACDWISCMLGIDPADTFRARVESALSAARVLEDAGGIEAIAERICAEHGWPDVPVALARRGDVVTCDIPTGHALGVCDGVSSAFVGVGGLEMVRTLACRRAWRIA